MTSCSKSPRFYGGGDRFPEPRDDLLSGHAATSFQKWAFSSRNSMIRLSGQSQNGRKLGCLRLVEVTYISGPRGWRVEMAEKVLSNSR